MSARVDLSAVQNVYRLGYVCTPWAWFTRFALDRQWGERWERGPYVRESGLPYADESDQIFKLGFSGPLLSPEEGANADTYSVQDINAKKTAWLHIERYFGASPFASWLV